MNLSLLSGGFHHCRTSLASVAQAVQEAFWTNTLCTQMQSHQQLEHPAASKRAHTACPSCLCPATRHPALWPPVVSFCRESGEPVTLCLLPLCDRHHCTGPVTLDLNKVALASKAKSQNTRSKSTDQRAFVEPSSFQVEPSSRSRVTDRTNWSTPVPKEIMRSKPRAREEKTRTRKKMTKKAGAET